MFTLPEERRRGASGSLAYFMGFVMSLFIHTAFALITIHVLEKSKEKATQIVEIFSVTLEGGEKLGGIDQVPVKDSKAPKVAPVAGVARKEEAPPPEPEKSEPEPIKSPQAKEEPPPPPPPPPMEEAKLEELPESKQKALEEAAALEESRRKAVEEEKKKKDEVDEKERLERAKKAEQDRLKKLQQEQLEKEKEEKARKAEEDKLKKEQEDKQRLVKEKKTRDDFLKKAIAASAERSEGGRSDYLGESANAGGKGFGAAALGGQGMGGGTVQSLAFVAYMNRLEQHIKSGWSWMGKTDRLVAQVLIRMTNSGDLERVQVLQSSGDKVFDESAERAVRKAVPFPPPPPELFEKFREVRITFDNKE